MTRHANPFRSPLRWIVLVGLAVLVPLALLSALKAAHSPLWEAPRIPVERPPIVTVVPSE